LECGDLSPLWFRCDLSQRLFKAAASSRREEKAVTSHRTPKFEITQIRQTFSVDFLMNGGILCSPRYRMGPPSVLIYLIETQPEIQTNMA
jgi:hypothetical protein